MTVDPNLSASSLLGLDVLVLWIDVVALATENDKRPSQATHTRRRKDRRNGHCFMQRCSVGSESALNFYAIRG
jgi:hypothetical protein